MSGQPRAFSGRFLVGVEPWPKRTFLPALRTPRTECAERNAERTRHQNSSGCTENSRRSLLAVCRILAQTKMKKPHCCEKTQAWRSMGLIGKLESEKWHPKQRHQGEENDDDEKNEGKEEEDNRWPPPPFERDDDFGICGLHGPGLSVVEWSRVVVRGFLVSCYVSAFAACLVASSMLGWRSPEATNRLWSKWLPIWTGGAMKLLGFGALKIRLVNQDENGNVISVVDTDSNKMPCVETSAPVLVSNHVSYLDIPILCWLLFPSFVAKESVQKVPIWGRLANVMQCTFVSRGSSSSSDTNEKADAPPLSEPRRKTMSTTDQLIQRIKHNSGLRGTPSQLPSIVVFPEGTTTNESWLLPFKTGVFAANEPVQPILLQYHWKRFNLSWESIGLMRHIVYTLAQPSHECTMTILNPIDPPPGPNTPTSTAEEKQRIAARAFADKTRNIMSKIGHLPMSEYTFREKKQYHEELRSNGYS